MESLLLRTNAALQDCERHLTGCNGFGTEIESYLTQYILVILCADVQQEMYRLSEERAAVANDPPLAHFISVACRKTLRSVKKGEIAGFLEQFGPGCKERLDSQLIDSEVTIYNNAVSSRHDVAHRHGSLITFRELKEAVRIAAAIITAAASSIQVFPAATPSQPPARPAASYSTATETQP